MNGSQRDFLAATGATLLSGPAGCISAPTDDGARGATDSDATPDETDGAAATVNGGPDGSLAGLEVAHKMVATGFAPPVSATVFEALGRSRRFIVDQPGRT